jgi:CheY-like chemotaxis protein
MAERILIVEDDSINVKFMRTVLVKKDNYDVYASEDVDEILETARNGNIAAIIMDVGLSNSKYDGKKVDGIFITKLLKKDPQTCHIPVLIATAHAMAGDRTKFLAESGAQDYLSKPIIDPNDLIDAVKRIIPTK